MPEPSDLWRSAYVDEGTKRATRSLTVRASARRAAICAPAQRPIAQFHPFEVNMALTNFKLLICVLILSESTLAQAECLRTVGELKANM